MATAAVSMENVNELVGTVARCCRPGRAVDASFEWLASMIAAAGRSLPEGWDSATGG